MKKNINKNLKTGKEKRIIFESRGHNKYYIYTINIVSIIDIDIVL
uniref:Uncharacterized protein n=1 Tax=viral metagenome TaxID=1070528 RepID=A0A6C0D1K2_9ZZZZ